MAVYVPAMWTQGTVMLAWGISFIIFMVWLFGIRGSTERGVGLQATWMYALLFLAWIPVSESLYMYNEDDDPWNNAPYVQWFCMQMRLAATSIFAFYLAVFTGRYWFDGHSKNHKNRHTGTAIRWSSFALVIFFAIFSSIVVGVKPTLPFRGDRGPYFVMDGKLTWTWAVVSIFSASVHILVLRWYERGRNSKIA